MVGRLADIDPRAWQSIVVGLSCPVALQVLLASGDVFTPGRTWWVRACMMSFAVFGLVALVRRRVGLLSLRLQLLEALVMIVVIGSSTQHLGVLASCFITVALVVVSTATYLGALELVGVTLGCAGAVAWVLAGQGVDGAPLLMTTVTVTVLGGVPGLVLLSFRRRLEQALLHADRLSRHDPLTGLLNRRGLARAAPALVERALTTGSYVGVLLLDVDHFKAVNDRYGHVIGDAVLGRLGRVVQGVSREGDLAARLGGEEVCLVVCCTSPDELSVLGERLRAAVSAARTDPPVAVGVTVSIGGAAERPRRGDDVVALVMRLVDRADVPLYEVKHAGRDAVRVAAA